MLYTTDGRRLHSDNPPAFKPEGLHTLCLALKARSAASPATDMGDGPSAAKDGEYVIEHIVDHRLTPGPPACIQFRVSWEGYTSARDTWEPCVSFGPRSTWRKNEVLRSYMLTHMQVLSVASPRLGLYKTTWVDAPADVWSWVSAVDLACSPSGTAALTRIGKGAIRGRSAGRHDGGNLFSPRLTRTGTLLAGRDVLGAAHIENGPGHSPDSAHGIGTTAGLGPGDGADASEAAPRSRMATPLPTTPPRAVPLSPPSPHTPRVAVDRENRAPPRLDRTAVRRSRLTPAKLLDAADERPADTREPLRRRSNSVLSPAEPPGPRADLGSSFSPAAARHQPSSSPPPISAAPPPAKKATSTPFAGASAEGILQQLLLQCPDFVDDHQPPGGDDDGVSQEEAAGPDYRDRRAPPPPLFSPIDELPTSWDDTLSLLLPRLLVICLSGKPLSPLSPPADWPKHVLCRWREALYSFSLRWRDAITG